MTTLNELVFYNRAFTVTTLYELVFYNRALIHRDNSVWTSFLQQSFLCDNSVWTGFYNRAFFVTTLYELVFYNRAFLHHDKSLWTGFLQTEHSQWQCFQNWFVVLPPAWDEHLIRPFLRIACPSWQLIPDYSVPEQLFCPNYIVLLHFLYSPYSLSSCRC